MALVAGFFITRAALSIIPEANRKGELSIAGIQLVAGISIHAVLI